MKLWKSAVPVFAIVLAGCYGASDTGQDDQTDLDQLANQIVITYPINGSLVSNSITTVRADVPAQVDALKLELYVDGLLVAQDIDGAPWEMQWPAYYWSDGGYHSLALKVTTADGDEVLSTQALSVLVSGANESLQFSEDVVGAELQDADSIEVGFSPFPNATQYEVILSGQGGDVKTSTGDSVVFDSLDVGERNLAYRAIWNITTDTTLTGPWSDAVAFSVIAPNLPELNSPVVTKQDTTYLLDFSWALQKGNNTYHIHLENTLNRDLSFDVSSVTDSAQISDVSAGEYEWTLQRENEFGHLSLVSQATSVAPGIFKQGFGGAGNDYAEQFIELESGDLIVRASTTSSDIDTQVDADSDDWIFKVNEKGEKLWETVLVGSGIYRLSDITELSDGTLIAVGQDWSTEQAYAVKLSNTGTVLWETFFRPESFTDRYEFIDVVEVNGEVYVSAAEWGSCGTNCTAWTRFVLHTLDPMTGEVASTNDIPVLNGAEISSISDLIAINGQMVISGIALPTGSDDHYMSGAFWARLTSDFVVEESWHNVNKAKHLNVGDFRELESGEYVLVGQSVFGEIVISITSPAGEDLGGFTGSSNISYTAGALISADSQGNFWVPLVDRSGESALQALYLFNSSGVNVDLIEFPELGESSSVRGIINSADGTYSLLVNEVESSGNNQDILLIRDILD